MELGLHPNGSNLALATDVRDTMRIPEPRKQYRRRRPFPPDETVLALLREHRWTKGLVIPAAALLASLGMSTGTSNKKKLRCLMLHGTSAGWQCVSLARDKGRGAGAATL